MGKIKRIFISKKYFPCLYTTDARRTIAPLNNRGPCPACPPVLKDREQPTSEQELLCSICNMNPLKSKPLPVPNMTGSW
jgi:hypothetical protein